METEYPIKSLKLPTALTEIADPPKQLYVRGSFPSEEFKFLAVVGSRSYTAYGKKVCEDIILGLRGYPVVIVSGLALGIDGIAHRSALRAGLLTVAVPGSGLHDSVLYPSTHRTLAHEILKNGGALVSEFDAYWKPRPESFPQRNRIMAGLSHAVLVVEAEERSGTLITSRLATEYNREVCAIPGPIDSPTAKGPHMLLQKGAALITQPSDICALLGIEEKTITTNSMTRTLSEEEASIRSALVPDGLERDALIQTLPCTVSQANILLSSLEIRGIINERMGKLHWVE